MLKEFRPSIVFLVKFLSIYLLGNIIYGIFIESFHSSADPITSWIASQTSALLNSSETSTHVMLNPHAASVFIMEGEHARLSIYEGCNGINVMIIFVAFIIAFGGALKNVL